MIEESAWQCRRPGFNPWSGTIPHAAKQLSPSTAAIEPVLHSPGATTAEPALYSPGATLQNLLSTAREPQLQNLLSTAREPQLQNLLSTAREPQLQDLLSTAREPQLLKPQCSGVRAPKQEKPLQKEAPAPQPESSCHLP